MPFFLTATRMLALIVLATASGAAEVRLDDATHELPAGRDDTAYAVARAATLIAKLPVICGGPISLERAGNGGVTATVIALTLREYTEDDWRLRTDTVGTRRDPDINLRGTMAGTPEDRRRFAVQGGDGDWDNFSIQWDGILDIPNAGVELATSSDDGSRVWLDRNDDGLVTADEWGSNGWGTGQGATQRTVHQNLPAGTRTIRVQFEEGFGGNSCRLLWRSVAGDQTWKAVPSEAFLGFARLTVEGPVTLAGSITGSGSLDCGDGVRLAKRPEVRSLILRGRVALAGDLDLRGIDVRFTTDAILDCAGHALLLDQAAGSGTITLAGGELTLPAMTLPLRLRGPGIVNAAPGTTIVAACEDSVDIRGDRFVVRDAQRCRARVPLSAPLTTMFTLGDDVPGDRALLVEVTVPAGSSSDLGIGVWRADRTGRWFQSVHPGALRPGRHVMRFALAGESLLHAEGHLGHWTPSAALESGHLGIFCFASTPGAAPLTFTTSFVTPTPVKDAATPLTDLALDAFDGQAAHAVTGKRWQMHVRPVPYPADPFDPGVFSLNLEVTEPDGARRLFAGFHDQDMRRHDDGDHERFTAVGAPRFTVRFRPRLPGIHRLRLITADRGGKARTLQLSDLLVSGQPGDGIARIDPQDPRFFSANGDFVWPLGHNLHSTYDTRSVGSLGSKLTVDRGSFVREALLERLVANGGSGCETWLSAWNLGLEWIPRWPGYRGAGRYHEGHAWALDCFLNDAERFGVRVNLSIFNHGMARTGAGAEIEWPFHPYNTENGGWLGAPVGLFTDKRAFDMQKRLFRYLASRYGDSPALLGWKLWAEVDLVDAPRAPVIEWHRHASEALSAADPYGHPVTSHWCGDWHRVDRVIAALPSISYLTIDAYHGENTHLADLLCQSLRDPLSPGQGLSGFGKPLIVTEFGGDAGACSQQRMEAEHAVGPWAGFVSGHAASPMLWWFEWIDQGERYGVYRALANFIAGEDLRGRDAACVAPTAAAGNSGLWCRAWNRPGRMLGYIVDREWAMKGGTARPLSDLTVTIGDAVAAGALTIEWWDADRGTVLLRQSLDHPGGPLRLAGPPCSRHIAFKMWRN